MEPSYTECASVANLKETVDYRRTTWPGNVDTWIPNPTLPSNSFVLSFSHSSQSQSNADAFRVRGQVNEIMLVKHFAPRKRFLCKHEILLDIIKLHPGQQWPGWALFLIYCLAKLGFFFKAKSVGGLLSAGVGDSDKWTLSHPLEQSKQIIWLHLIVSILY